MPLSLALRCDASRSIGVGHVARCIALAERAHARGWEITLLGRVDGANWLLDMAPWLTVTPVPVDPHAHFDVVVLDSYLLTEADLRDLQRASDLMVAIVDSGQSSLPADVFVHHGAFNVRPRTDSQPGQIHVGGLDYLLIGDRFRAALSNSEALATGTMGVLIATGGTDALSATDGLVAAALGASSECRLDVVTNGLLESVAALDGCTRVRLHQPGAGTASLAVAADVVVGAAGVSALEWLYLRKPMAVLQVVDNQRHNYDFLTESGMAVGLGRVCDGEPLDARALAALLTDPNVRSHLLNRIDGAVDGLGAMRVMDLIEESLRLRRLEVGHGGRKDG